MLMRIIIYDKNGSASEFPDIYGTPSANAWALGRRRYVKSHTRGRRFAQVRNTSQPAPVPYRPLAERLILTLRLVFTL